MAVQQVRRASQLRGEEEEEGSAGLKHLIMLHGRSTSLVLGIAVGRWKSIFKMSKLHQSSQCYKMHFEFPYINMQFTVKVLVLFS